MPQIRPRPTFGASTAACLLAASAAASATDVTQMTLEQLLDVTISGASKYDQKQGDVAAAVSVITRHDIQAFGWRTIDEALQSLPGVHNSYDRQYHYLGARGFGLPGDYATRLLLTIDGNRVNDAVYDSAISGFGFPVDLDLIERIEFIPGPGGAVYGQNALFGVINVVTRAPESFDGAELSVSYLDPQDGATGRASYASTFANGASLLASVTLRQEHGLDLYSDFGAAGVVGVARDMDGLRDRELLLKASGGPWSFTLAAGDRRKDDPAATYFSDPLVPGQYQRDRVVLSQLQYREDLLAGDLQFSGRIFHGQHRYYATFSYDTLYEYTGSSDWYGVDLQLVSKAYDHHTLLAGFELQDVPLREQQAIDVANSSVEIDINQPGWRGAIYLQDDWQLHDSLRATLGLRADRDSISGNQFSPRAGLTWNPLPGTTAKVLFGRAHRGPNSYERDYGDGTVQAANPLLDEETIDTTELIVEQRIGEELRLRASAYEWRMQGIVTLTTNTTSGLTQYRNGEDVEARGLEMSADKSWSGGTLLRANLTLQDAQFADGSRLANSPHMLGKINVSAPLPVAGLRLGYEMQYVGERETIDGTELDDYTLANLSITADTWAETWLEGLAASLTLYNLFDTSYAHAGSDTTWQNAIEQDGRSARLVISYRF